MGRSRLIAVAIAAIAAGSPAAAEYRFTIAPSIRATAVHDDNINGAERDPLRDAIARVSPSLDLLLESRRLTARGTFSVDSETYDEHPELDDDSARQQAMIGLTYHAGPRLTLALDGSCLQTNTLTELNAATGLTGSRLSAKRSGAAASARLRLSPRATAIAATAASRTRVEDGDSIDSTAQSVFVERRSGGGSTISAGYEHAAFAFDGRLSHHVDTHALIARWQHSLNWQTTVSVHAGPRWTTGAPRSTDLAASVTRDWKSFSSSLLIGRTQTTLLGYTGLVDSTSVEARMAWKPSRRLRLHAAPAVIRTTHEELEGNVYRAVAGASYAVAPYLDLDIAYHIDRQRGAIDPLRSDISLSRDVVSIGFSTRWNTRERSQ